MKTLAKRRQELIGTIEWLKQETRFLRGSDHDQLLPVMTLKMRSFMSGEERSGPDAAFWYTWREKVD